VVCCETLLFSANAKRSGYFCRCEFASFLSPVIILSYEAWHKSSEWWVSLEFKL
jgi:hypothetical protein